MPAGFGLSQFKLAEAATTGNNTHTATGLPPGALLALPFEIEVAGATPTVTWKFQGSFDAPDIADASSDWFDLMVLPGDSNTGVVSQTKTTVGVFPSFLELPRFIRKIRLVTSANTNVTYNGLKGQALV